jgi:putative flippase GtrA
MTFVGVGGACLLIQLSLLHVVLVTFQIESRLGESLANAFAFLVSTQANFWLSRSTTWRDRRVPGTSVLGRLKQQLAFNALAMGGLAINQTVFLLTSRHIGAVPASGIGTVAASGVTFLVSAFAVFPSSARARKEAYDAIG